MADSRNIVTITTPWPVPAVRSNSRTHWAIKAKATKTARGTARMLAKAAGVATDPNARMFIEYYPKAFREDPQNVPAGLKPFIDGIADAMGCDDRGFIVDYPTQFAGRSKQGEVVFRIECDGATIPFKGQIS